MSRSTSSLRQNGQMDNFSSSQSIDMEAKILKTFRNRQFQLSIKDVLFALNLSFNLPLHPLEMILTPK